MIYTVDHLANYLTALAEAGIQGIKKKGKDEAGSYFGGIVFHSREDAELFLRLANLEPTWAVFGVEADWERDTYELPTTGERHLLIDAPILYCPQNDRRQSPMNQPPALRCYYCWAASTL